MVVPRAVCVLLLCAVLGFSSSQAQLTRTYANSKLLDADNNFWLYWEPDDTANPTTLRIGMKARIKGYISIGWSLAGTMVGLDTFMCYVDSVGTGYIGDFYVSGRTQPALDPDQTFTEVSVGRTSAGVLYCEFDRPFDNQKEFQYDKPISNDGSADKFVWAVHRTVVPSSLQSWGSIHDVFSELPLSIIFCPGCGSTPGAPVLPPPPKTPPAAAPKAVQAPSATQPITVGGGLPKTLYNPGSNTWDGITVAPPQPVTVLDKKGTNNNGYVLTPVPNGASELKPYFQYSLVLSNRSDSPFYIFWNITEDKKSIIMGMQTTMAGSTPRWFGLGFGGYDRAHMRADIVFAVNKTVQDRFSAYETEPYLDETQSLTGVSHTYYSFHGANWQTAIFGRSLAQNDKDDRPIFLEMTNMVAWAIGSGMNDKHGDQTVGAVWIDFQHGTGHQYSLMRDEYEPNIWKGAYIFFYLLFIYIVHKTIFESRHLHALHYEYFWLHYFKFSVWDMLLLASWVIAVSVFTVIWWDPRKDLGIIFAVGCEMPAALVFIAAIRIQFWDVIYDISYERQIRYHRWVAWTLFYLLAAHCLYVFGHWIIRGSLFDEFKLKEIVFGAVAGLQLLVIAITALRLFRRHFWELFKWVHFTFILFVLWGALHEVKFLWFVLPGLLVWGLDRTRRFWTWFGQPAEILSVKLMNDVTEIKFKKRNFDYRAGQFAFILMPEVSRLQLHPFSISSSPRDPFVSIHAKAMGNFSDALKKLPDKNKVKIVVEGPYGYKPNWKDYDVVALFGAGIGATPWISIVRDYLQDNENEGPDHLYFFFSVTHKSNLSWFDETWDLAKQSQNTGLHIQKFITREKPAEGDVRADSDITFGRPNFMTILGEMVQNHAGKIRTALVMTCGPGIFSRGVQDAAFAHSHHDRVIFEFHDEVFKF